MHYVSTVKPNASINYNHFFPTRWSLISVLDCSDSEYFENRRSAFPFPDWRINNIIGYSKSCSFVVIIIIVIIIIIIIFIIMAFRQTPIFSPGDPKVYSVLPSSFKVWSMTAFNTCIPLPAGGRGGYPLPMLMVYFWYF